MKTIIAMANGVAYISELRYKPEVLENGFILAILPDKSEIYLNVKQIISIQEISDEKYFEMVKGTRIEIPEINPKLKKIC